MEYHKDQHRFARSVAYLRAPLAVQGAHAWLLRLCSERENGGRIADCVAWDDHDWRAATHAQVGRRAVLQVVAANLAQWDGDHLRVDGYDLAGEQECLRERQRLRDHRERMRERVRDAFDTARAPRDVAVQPSPAQPGPAPSTSSPTAAPAPAWVDAVDITRAARALARGDVLDLVRAFRGNLDGMRADEWLLACDSLRVDLVAAILGWRRDRGDPVREPSGFRKARAEWRDLTPNQRATARATVGAWLGVSLVLPPKPAPPADDAPPAQAAT